MTVNRYAIGLAALATVLLGAQGAGASGAKVLNIYNWSDYIAEDTIANFEREFGVKVNYDVYDSNQMVEAKLLAGSSGYDIVVPTVADAERLITAGLFRRIDKSQLRNYGNLDPNVLRAMAAYDPDNAHAVPYMWGTNGYAYNVDKIKEVLGADAPTDSWSLVFDPQYAQGLKKCGFAVLDDPGEVIDPVLFYLGQADGPTDRAKIESAFATLEKIRPYVTYFHSSQYINDLANGNICAALAFSGDALIARDRAVEAENGVQIRYVIPKEGTLIWFDAMMIPADAPHPELALQFIDYILRPEVSAAITNYVTYAGPNLAALPLIDPEIRNDAGVYPSEEIKARLKGKKEPAQKLLRLRTRLWTKFKTGQ